MSWFRKHDNPTPPSNRSAQTTCAVTGCENPRWGNAQLCDGHQQEALERLAESERQQDERR